MTAHFVVKSFNGKAQHMIEHFPLPDRIPKEERCLELERYELTDEQAQLSVDELKARLAAGQLKKWETRP